MFAAAGDSNGPHHSLIISKMYLTGGIMYYLTETVTVFRNKQVNAITERSTLVIHRSL